MADPVVFVPGLNCTAELYQSQIAAVAPDRAVMIANHRRHDRLDGLAAALLAEAPPRFALVGLSMGGYVAFEVMRQAPDRVSALVLMDTTARPDGEEARERRLRQIAIAEGGRFAEIPPMQIPLLIAESRHGDGDLTGLIRRMAEATGAAAFVRQQRAILGRPDSRPDLATIACPTLVIVGDQDAITPPEHAVEIAEGIPGAVLKVMPVCGHLATIERPSAVDHALASFLAGRAD